ncbi:predicted protein [Postia placenta Mad-698-R]|nr:predicted protein [Postia placenta Mad-698-R]
MSSDAAVFNYLDATADAVTIAAPVTKPVLKYFAGLSPRKQLKRGNKYQASTLSTLEQWSEIMDSKTHNELQQEHDRILATSNGLQKMGRLKALWELDQFYAYASEAEKLNADTVTSSQAARSKQLWSKKGMTGGQSLDAAVGYHDDAASVDITTIEENPFRETASVVVADYASDLGSEASVTETESIYSEPGDIGHYDSLSLHALRPSA